MDCSEAEALLSARLDGELDGASGAELERHLEACLDCRRRLAALAAARDHFRRLAPEPSGLRAAAILARAAAAAEAAARRRRARRWVPLAAALALAAALGLWWERSGGERSEPGSGATAVPAATARPTAAPGAAEAPGGALDCGPGGEDCRRLACYSAADCGADASPVWPPLDL